MSKKNDGLTLTPKLASLLASVVVHADELLNDKAHYVDRDALQTVFDHPEVKKWLKDIGPLAPEKR